MEKILILLGRVFIAPIFKTVLGSMRLVEGSGARNNHVSWILFFINLSFWAMIWLRINNLLRINLPETVFVTICAILFFASLLALYLMRYFLHDCYVEDACCFLATNSSAGSLISAIFFFGWITGEHDLIFMKSNFFNLLLFTFMFIMTAHAIVFWRGVRKNC